MRTNSKVNNIDLNNFEDINLSELWKEFSLIKNWLKNIKETHSFQQTYYFGSLLTEKYPHLKNMRKKND